MTSSDRRAALLRSIKVDVQTYNDREWTIERTIDLALEEAAKVAEEEARKAPGSGSRVALAIRALKSKP